MKVQIIRTSVWEGRPCKEARKEVYEIVDRRCANDINKIPYYKNNPEKQKEWWDFGKDHRKEGNTIARTLPPIDVWVMDVDTLADVLKLYEKYGDIIISYPRWEYIDPNAPQILLEIYDNYRE